MRRRPSVLLAAFGCAAILAAGGCGKDSSSSSSSPSPSAAPPAAAEANTPPAPTTKFATTKFIFHAGLALGAFHHFIYKPFRAGEFLHPLQHKAVIFEAGLAGLFIYHELKFAARDAKSSKLLRGLFAPITQLANKLSTLKSSIAGGRASVSDLAGVQSELGHLASSAASKGKAIPESVPSVAQLANPPA